MLIWVFGLFNILFGLGLPNLHASFNVGGPISSSYTLEFFNHSNQRESCASALVNFGDIHGWF